MKRIIIVLLLIISVLVHHPASSIAASSEVDLRDDVILELLFSKIDKELYRQFHEIMQFDCQQIISLKRDPQGGFYFDVDVQVVTFEGSHNPPNYLVNLSFTNSTQSGKWEVTAFKKRLLNKAESIPCRQSD